MSEAVDGIQKDRATELKIRPSEEDTIKLRPIPENGTVTEVAETVVANELEKFQTKELRLPIGKKMS